MKLRIQNLITLLMITFILLTGCDRKQQAPEQVEVPADSQIEITLSEKTQSETVPTTLYPPENPHEDLTVTGTAPPSDYQGNPILWIPEFEYELESNIAEKYAVSLPIAPKHAEKWARYEQRVREDFYKLKKRREGVTSVKRKYDMNREVEAELKNQRAEIMTQGMTPLNAAKYLVAHNINTDHNKQYAQQALDDNPNDYHTLLVWTHVQEDFEKQRGGYRRLIRMRPNSAYALYRLGDITFTPEAIPILKKAYQYAPDVPADHPTFLKTGILYELAKAYFNRTRDDAKALETLQCLSKYDSELSEVYIQDMQRNNRIGMVGRPQKAKTNE